MGPDSQDHPDSGRREAVATVSTRRRVLALLGRPGVIGERPVEGATAVGYALVTGAVIGSMVTLGPLRAGLTDGGLVALAAVAALGQSATNDGVAPSVGAAVALTSGVHLVGIPVTLAVGGDVSTLRFAHAAALGVGGGTAGCAAGLVARRGFGMVRRRVRGAVHR